MRMAPWAAEVIKKLREAGFLAYAVGGCVRDLLLGRSPKDWDVATSALPEQVEALFSKTVATGVKHGTVTVLLLGKTVEVTTFRREGRYSDCRRPDQVRFTKDPELDAARRDFTINALYWDGQGEILDFFAGQDDLKQKRLRTVGDGKQRFSEDALRILRAARFSAQLGFYVTGETRAAMEETANLLRYISRERIGEEMEKILLSDPVQGFSLLKKTGCLQVIDSRIFADEQEWKVCASLPLEQVARWAALLWHSSQVHGILRELRRPSAVISRVVWLIGHCDTVLQTDYQMKRLAADGGIQALYQLLLIRQYYGEQGMMERFERICGEQGFVTLQTLAVTGQMLLEQGICSGPEIGQARKWLLEQVLLGQVPNEIGKLTKKLREKR